MSENITEFSINLRQFARRTVPENHAKLVKKVAFQVLRGVIFKTPVDTGRARANWSVTSGRPTSMQVNDVDPSGNKALAAGAAEINAADTMRKVIWIQNNLPYITALENGHSQQAPLGMVALTLTEVKDQLA